MLFEWMALKELGPMLRRYRMMLPDIAENTEERHRVAVWLRAIDECTTPQFTYYTQPPPR